VPLFDLLRAQVDRDFRKSNTDQATLRFEHDFGSNITLRNTARFSHTFQGYSFLLPDDSTGNVVGTSATNTVNGGVTNFINGGYVWRRANTRVGTTDSLIDQTDLTAKFNTGFIKHSVATGLEFSSEDASRGTYVLATGSTITPRCNTNTIARYYCAPCSIRTPTIRGSITPAIRRRATPITRSPGYADIDQQGHHARGLSVRLDRDRRG
jgi:outer membrane receptor for monomeric catechols